jgi:hypothetical protein
MDVTGSYGYVRWDKRSSERQIYNVFSHMQSRSKMMMMIIIIIMRMTWLWKGDCWGENQWMGRRWKEGVMGGKNYRSILCTCVKIAPWNPPGGRVVDKD